MTVPNVLKAIRMGEGPSVEFRTSVRDPTTLGRAACAFANSGGGLIVVGADVDGGVRGVKNPEEICRRITSALTEKLTPHTPVWVTTEQIDQSSVILVEVPAGQDVPYAYENVIYLRDAGRTRTATVEEIRDLVLRRSVEPIRWERRLSTCAVETDVDQGELARARTEIHGRNEPLVASATTGDSLLGRLDMAKYGRLTNGGVVVFAREPGRTFPQARARAVAFVSDKTDDAFRDQKRIDAPLIGVINELFAFVVRNTSTRSTFTAGLQREDQGMFPTAALREAIVNAVVHRDYTQHGGGVAAHVYPDRVEIWNSGSLPEALTPALLLKRGHVSILRNPDIADVVYLRGLMEKVGRGSVMIAEACRRAGLPRPEWTSDPNRGVTLTLRAPRRRGETVPEVIPEETPDVIPEVIPEVSRQQHLPATRLLRALRGDMGARELQFALGVKDREDFRARFLSPAVKQGWVKMTLPDKPRSSHQRYRISAKGIQMLKKT